MKEPIGLSRSDGRRPGGLTLLPWYTGKPLSWDVTVAATLADSYISATSSTGGAAAELAATRKMAKYADLPASYLFQPVALETLGQSMTRQLISCRSWGQNWYGLRRDQRAPVSLPEAFRDDTTF